MDHTDGIAAPAIRTSILPWVAVGICVAINMLDGFDVLAISWTAPDIAKQWMLGPAEIGLLLSAGLAGMTLGSLSLSPIADLFGRRTVLLTCLTLISAAMLLSSLAKDLTELAAFRFVTGLGIGGVLSGINTAAAEYVDERQRDFAIGLVTSGYPLGATLGGLAAIQLVTRFGWPAVFVFGGALSFLLIPLVWILLPESISFLLARRPRNALNRLNEVLARLDQPPLAALPDAPLGEGAAKPRLLDIFSRDMRAGTAFICGAFFMNMLTFYFILSWTPKVLVDMGLSTGAGISASVLLNLCGVAGGVICGIGAGRIGLARITGLYLTMAFALAVTFALMPVVVPALMITIAVLGFFLLGTMVGLYAIVANVFPTHVRATGTGLAIGVGRVGATIGPALAGVLIAWGWSRPLYWTVLAAPALIAAYLAVHAAKRARPSS